MFTVRKIIILGNDIEVKRYLQSQQNNINRIVSAIKSIKADSEDDQSVNEPLLYDAIKEKVIYKECQFVFDGDLLFSSISKQYNETTGQLLNDNKELILKVLSFYSCENLRSCKIALENYESISNMLNLDVKNGKEINNILFLTTFTDTIMVKTGNDRFPSIEELDYNNIYNIKAIYDYVANSIWNEDDIKKEINTIDKQISADKDEDRPDCIKALEGSWFMKTDDEIRESVHTLKNNLSDINIKYYFKALEIFDSYCSWYEDDEISLDDAFDTMRNKVNNCKGKIEVDDYPVGFFSMHKNIKKYVKDLLDLISEHNKAIMFDKLNEEIRTTEDFTFEKLKEIHANSLDTHCFFGRIDIESLAEKIKTSDANIIMQIKDVIASVYSFHNLGDFYKGDLENLKLFKLKLELLIESEKSVVKTKAMELLYTDVNNYIERIEKWKEN